MRMRHQRAGEPHVVGLRGVDDRVDLPRGIHHDALAGHRVADEIDEVLHRSQLELLEIDSRLAHGVPCYSGNLSQAARADRKSTRLNSSHANISYAVFCLKKLFESPPSLFQLE